MRSAIPVVVGLLSLTVTAGTNQAADDLAAPHIIMLHGDLLKEPIYLTDWNLNLRFIVEMVKG